MRWNLKGVALVTLLFHLIKTNTITNTKTKIKIL